LGVLWALPPPEPPLLFVEVNLRTGPDPSLLCADIRAAVRGAAVGVQDGLTLVVVVHRADLIFPFISFLFLFFLFFSPEKRRQAENRPKPAQRIEQWVTPREALNHL
jgi:hypothetical protein